MVYLYLIIIQQKGENTEVTRTSRLT